MEWVHKYIMFYIRLRHFKTKILFHNLSSFYKLNDFSWLKQSFDSINCSYNWIKANFHLISHCVTQKVELVGWESLKSDVKNFTTCSRQNLNWHASVTHSSLSSMYMYTLMLVKVQQSSICIRVPTNHTTLTYKGTLDRIRFS